MGRAEIREDRWLLKRVGLDYQKYARELGTDPVVVRIMANRGLRDSASMRKYLYGSAEDLYEPDSMKDIGRAAGIIRDSISRGAKIRVIGDYDIDGIMSSYILVTGLSRIGADVDERIPERERDGYGLNERLVREAAEDGIETIVTCDNGIAAYDQVALAEELGMTVVVTDHHEVPKRGGEEVLPPADAVVNPHRSDSAYPFRELCGAGVAYKLVCLLYRECGVPKAEADDLLQYAGFATIGDVMDLTDENRIIASEGLKRMSRTDNIGMRALIRQCHLEGKELTAYHVGFVLGPCLNASGRLDTAERAERLLRTQDPEEAERLAGDLVSLNHTRQALTVTGVEEAINQVENTELADDPVLVVFLEDVEPSIAGLIAGRLRERYYRPTFVLVPDSSGKVRGSGRSTDEYSMYEELCSCADLLVQFGGHPMAAGLTLERGQVEPFRRKINSRCSLSEEDMHRKIRLDMVMPFSYITEGLVEEIGRAAPFGKGNPSPVFAERGVRAENIRIFGQKRNVAKMTAVLADGSRIPAVYFGDADAFAEFARENPGFLIIYRPEIDTWMDRRSLQIVIQGFKAAKQ